MTRISRNLFLTALVVGGGLTAAHAQDPWRTRPNCPTPPPYQSIPAVAQRMGPATTETVPTSGPPMPVNTVPSSSVPTPQPDPGQLPPPPGLPEPTPDLAALQGQTVSIAPAVDSHTATSGPVVQSVNSTDLVIDFELKGQGPSGVGTVELWYTRNGQVWRKFNGAQQIQSPFAVDVSEDGLYGFTVLARNGLGMGPAAPRPGDPPQTWVEVDTTKPVVHLKSTHAGVDGAGRRTLSLTWTATDRNLVDRPITLFYAEQADGPWIPFATNLPNSGYYTWHMSSGLSSQLLVRVVATDRVGNLGEDRSPTATPIDPNLPTATIRQVTRNGVLDEKNTKPTETKQVSSQQP